MDQNELDNLMQDIALSPEKETVSDDDIGWDDVKEELPGAGGAVAKTEVGEVHFKELVNVEHGNSSVDLDFLMDIPLTMSVELGRCRLLISEMLQLGQGSVIELMKLAGEPMEIFVNQKLIARGEVVVVNEKFGVRLTDIISPAERVNRLK